MSLIAASLPHKFTSPSSSSSSFSDSCQHGTLASSCCGFRRSPPAVRLGLAVPRGGRRRAELRGAAGEQGRRDAAVRDDVPAADAAGAREGRAGPRGHHALGGLRRRVRVLVVRRRAVRCQALPPPEERRLRHHLPRRAIRRLPQRHLQRVPQEHRHERQHRRQHHHRRAVAAHHLPPRAGAARHRAGVLIHMRPHVLDPRTRRRRHRHGVPQPRPLRAPDAARRHLRLLPQVRALPPAGLRGRRRRLRRRALHVPARGGPLQVSHLHAAAHQPGEHGTVRQEGQDDQVLHRRDDHPTERPRLERKVNRLLHRLDGHQG